ncbi:spermidine synthase [Methylicorpusculum sp.]|uniref:spermidine synthase n=1 Tax=Methylicorpusculum sp. TaxID=2713644 RepID=UPI0027214A63|nr:fused MFS/spermidine synthase [Methylicorpusculum sp.]MDO8844916.1 fused MFS/spermidine synthase [Methylicorpusculum sp.]
MINTTDERLDNRRYWLIALFAITLFSSATLMFIMQPMYGKLLLPLLGGTPAVWNTCMVFYQTILFLGYLYAHFISVRFKALWQVQIHAVVILLSLAALPLGLPDNALPPTDSNPTFWLLTVLTMTIGLPFFVVSTTAPLLQKWFSGLGHHTSHDPYYLYTASNAGSLIALLSYPFLLEPNIGLGYQQLAWSAGYSVLCLMIVISAGVVWSEHSKVEPDTQVSETTTDKPALLTQVHWLLLALVPSSLLLGLTNFISTDIASAPLLWIIPLTLYLLSFVIVFSRWNRLVHPLMVKLQPMVLLPFLAYSYINPAVLPYWLDLCIHALAFFLAVMVCHGELANRRPGTQHLTHFYLTMSFAGMLGGMFNTFVAPFVFDAVYEYPIMIVAALLLRPGLNITSKTDIRGLLKQSLFPLLVLFSGVLIYFLVDNVLTYLDALGAGLILLAGLTYAFRQQPLSLGLLTGTLIFFTVGLHAMVSNTIFQDRTFFGVLSVRESMLIDEQGNPERYNEIFHGTTKHGAQRRIAREELTPYTYYSRPGPMGQLFKEFDQVNENWNIGLVGLGAGAMMCYAKNQQHWTLYEIDPLVVSIANNPEYFTYLSKCSHNATTVIGDARQSLVREDAEKFDFLIVDAFSSDSIPTHLLTQEAIKLYFSKLKPQGMLAFHITNRHLALKKVLADHAKQLNYAALIQEFKPQDEQPLVVATDWVVMAANAETLMPLANSQLGKWQKMPLYFDMKPWTDDYTSIVNLWK